MHRLWSRKTGQAGCLYCKAGSQKAGAKVGVHINS
jgi:hypothetical protein